MSDREDEIQRLTDLDMDVTHDSDAEVSYVAFWIRDDMLKALADLMELNEKLENS